MNKPIISIDIDDVLADSTESLRLLVNTRTGHSLTREDYRIVAEYWGYYETVWRNAGVGHLIDFVALNAEMIDDQSHVPAVEQARETLEALRNKYRFVLVTSREESWKEATEKWIEAVYGDLFEGLYFTGNRHSDGYKNKGELCAAIGASLHIDDNVDHCRSVTEQGVEAVLFGEYGWHYDVPADLKQFKTWKELGAYLKDAKLSRTRV